MKRVLFLAALCAAILGVSWGAYRAASPPEPELSRFVPSGALLYLQARDFSSVLSDWDKSGEKKTWIKTRNHDEFSNSRLLLRLKDAGTEFSKAAGVPADASLLQQITGKQTAFALYDIGKLQFLYVTRGGSSDFSGSALWQTRAKFETRTAGGMNFYYRKDPESEREVAFAETSDYVLLATREELMAGALELIAQGKGHSIEEDAWWQRAVSASGTPGDLRMVLNLEKIVPSPYFRSYWVPQNVTDMKQYTCAISDLTRTGGEYREERLLFRKTQATFGAEAGKGPSGVADLLRLAPEDTGLYEAKADPAPEQSIGLLETKILAPHLGPAAPEKIAPQVQLGNGEIGGASDLESRIDQPPAQYTGTANNRATLQDLFSKNHVLAQLQVQGTDRDPAGVFVRIHSGVAFLGESEWDERKVQAALADFVSPAFSTEQLGLVWKNSSGHSVLDGLWPLGVAVRGKYLIVSDDPALLGAMLAGLNKNPDAAPSAFSATFHHGRERANFVALTKQLDRETGQPANGGGTEFFSGNIASLSFALKDVASEKITVRDSADRQTQTVVYAWAR
ncbi:MAG TPA: hypothetical protein VKB48_07730 [Candidatus Acidoferrum sp.]|nr:hypothetical protein [Candidatus Acidoferrum sp.]